MRNEIFIATWEICSRQTRSLIFREKKKTLKISFLDSSNRAFRHDVCLETKKKMSILYIILQIDRPYE